MTTRTYLDVDGVINSLNPLYGDHWPVPTEELWVYEANGFTLYLPDHMAALIQALDAQIKRGEYRLPVDRTMPLMQIRDAIQDVLNPQGVAVVIEATHMCMVMRGVQKQHSATTTSAMSGLFLNDQNTRNEFMRLIK